MLATNRAFYDAFEARDLDRMSDIWEHSDRVLCTHPGWATLRGWGQISASWVALFSGAQHLQFILTDERAEVAGDTAWVSVDENILSDDAGGTVAALNVLARLDEGWKVVVHHGSPVAATRREG
ncbi:MAG: nuclear transport factor 2 family protein [Acidimicrobiia bacterium]|nr:nuclear transport factor 2 family protein [Acidimicrobiia bacterium]